MIKFYLWAVGYILALYVAAIAGYIAGCIIYDLTHQHIVSDELNNNRGQ